MTISDQLQVEALVRAGMHDLAHAIVESCYRQAKVFVESGKFEKADNWSLLARRLTQIEDFAARMAL